MTKHYHSGYDYFTPDPGEKQSMKCRACNSEMDVDHNMEISSRYPNIGDASSKRKVDRFTCPHSGEKWHNQAIELKKLIERTPSQTIADLVEAELNQVVSTKKSSKNSWSL